MSFAWGYCRECSTSERRRRIGARQLTMDVFYGIYDEWFGEYDKVMVRGGNTRMSTLTMRVTTVMAKLGRFWWRVYRRVWAQLIQFMKKWVKLMEWRLQLAWIAKSWTGSDVVAMPDMHNLHKSWKSSSSLVPQKSHSLHTEKHREAPQTHNLLLENHGVLCLNISFSPITCNPHTLSLLHKYKI